MKIENLKILKSDFAKRASCYFVVLEQISRKVLNSVLNGRRMDEKTLQKLDVVSDDQWIILSKKSEKFYELIKCYIHKHLDDKFATIREEEHTIHAYKNGKHVFLKFSITENREFINVDFQVI